MVKNNIKKTISFLLAFVLLSSFAFAANTETKIFYGQSTSNPVTNVSYFMYQCTDSTCSSPTSWTPMYNDNTGTSSQASFAYPNTAGTTYYAQYFYAPCYWTEDWKMWSWGTFSDFSNNVVFEKRTNCASVVDSFSVINSVKVNEPVEINVQANLDANTASAFHRQTTRVDFFPTDGPDGSEYLDHYSAATTVTLQILDSNNNVVYTATDSFELFWDTIKPVSFTWTPTTAGTYTARILTDVTDCQCESAIQQSTSKTFNVVDANANNICYTLLNDLTINNPDPESGDVLVVDANKISNARDGNGALSSLTTNISFNAYRDNSLVYSTSQTAAANSDTTNAYSFSINTGHQLQAGEYVVSMTASSNNCPYSTNYAETETVNFTVIASQGNNRAPVFLPIGDKNASEGQLLQFTVSALDPDNDPLTYSTSNLPSGAAFSGQTFSWTPGASAAGAYSVTFSVSDGTFSTSETITITINNVNQAPVITSTAVTAATEGVLYQYTVTATDTDGDTLTYSLTVAPTGMAINSASGLISWTPSFTQSGNHAVTVQVSDGNGGTAAQSFTIAVTNANQAPSLNIPDQTVNEDAGFLDNLVDLFSHALDDITATANLIFSIVSQSATNIISCSLDSNRYIDCATKENQQGNSDVTVRAQDETGLTTDDTFRIKVVGTQPSNARDLIYMGSIAFDNEFPSPGDELRVYVNFENIGTQDIRDTRITGIIQELGIRSLALKVELDDGDKASSVLTLEIPENAQPGRYWVEIVIDIDGDRRVKYRPFDVI